MALNELHYTTAFANKLLQELAEEDARRNERRWGGALSHRCHSGGSPPVASVANAGLSRAQAPAAV
jgi:hypothetical protein